MKRGCPRHPKVADLAARLNLPKYSAVGILEMLWHFTAEFALPGDIGRFSDDAIATALCYDGPSTVLVSCLVDSRWLDRCTCHRLRIHDWKDHADQTVVRVLANRHQQFIKCYDDPSTMLASFKDDNSLPSPSPSPSPKALPLPSAPVKHPELIDGKPTMEDCEAWLADVQKNGADYSHPEMKTAFLALSANGWMWGRNPVLDYRAAIERQIQTDRQRKPNAKSLGNRSQVDRNAGTCFDAARHNAAIAKLQARRKDEDDARRKSEIEKESHVQTV